MKTGFFEVICSFPSRVCWALRNHRFPVDNRCRRTAVLGSWVFVAAVGDCLIFARGMVSSPCRYFSKMNLSSVGFRGVLFWCLLCLVEHDASYELKIQMW